MPADRHPDEAVDPGLEARLHGLVERYPVTCRQLIAWLTEPGLHGRFELVRHGTEKVVLDVSRRREEAG